MEVENNSNINLSFDDIVPIHDVTYRLVARDIGGSDPERMAAPKVAEYMSQMFSEAGSGKPAVKVCIWNL